MAITEQIKSHNRDMIHRTKDFEKQVRLIEIAQKQARHEEILLKRQIRAAK